MFLDCKKYSVEDALKMIMNGNSSDMEQLEEDDEEEEEWTPKMLSALYLHCTVQLQILKMVHLQLMAHCYSGGNQCMLQKRPVETAAQAETPAPVNVSGFCWHCPHECKKGQKVGQTTVLSRSNANPSPEEKNH